MVNYMWLIWINFHYWGDFRRHISCQLFFIMSFIIRLISFIIQLIWKESRDTLIVNYSCWFADYSKLLPLFECWEDSPCHCNYWGWCHHCHYWWLYFVWQWLQMTMLLTNLPKNLAMNRTVNHWQDRSHFQFSMVLST